MTLNNRAFWSQAKTAQVQQRLVYMMECARASPEMGVKACLKKKKKKKYPPVVRQLSITNFCSLSAIPASSAA